MFCDITPENDRPPGKRSTYSVILPGEVLPIAELFWTAYPLRKVLRQGQWAYPGSWNIQIMTLDHSKELRRIFLMDNTEFKRDLDMETLNEVRLWLESLEDVPEQPTKGP